MGKFLNFELAEFLKSDTAKRNGIDNYPSFEVVEHLSELIEKFVQPLRTAYGKPIIISSGYRCEKLNKAVGGSATSVHMKGWAADMQISGNMKQFQAFVDFATTWARNNRIPFDQLLIENSGKEYWLHVGLKSNNGAQRRQILKITV